MNPPDIDSAAAQPAASVNSAEPSQSAVFTGTAVSTRSAADARSATPMLRQYHAIKARHPGTILMFRMGDFFEMFFEDAVTASRTLGITLTARGKGTENAAAMCGVPYAAADQYIARLVGAGFRVAVCDQVEEPSQAKKLVRREVVRVVTPGTVTDPDQLDARAPSHIVAIVPPAFTRGAWGLAVADLSTGDFRLSELPASASAAEAADALSALSPREILYPEGFPPPAPPPPFHSTATERPDWSFSAEAARRSLATRLRVSTLAGFGLDGHDAATGAAGALLGYLEETQKAALTHMDRVRFVEAGSHLVMDGATRRNLELVRSLADGSTRATLLAVVDRTETAMGGRALRERLLAPLVDIPAINERLDVVQILLADPLVRASLGEALGGIGDLERLLSRCALGTATPRDLGAMRASLRPLPTLRGILSGLCREGGQAGTAALAKTVESLPDLATLSARLEAALGDDLPAHPRDGGFVRDGFDPVVDETRSLSRDARGALAAIEARERARTGISSLKVRYNRVFGYYIEISKSNLPAVPADYERRQTLVGGERYVTAELKDYEERVLTAQDRLVERELEIFRSLREAIGEAAGGIRAAAGAIAALDVARSFAEVAAGLGWCRPVLDAGTSLAVTAGRHPVVESLLPAGTFVPNDLALDAQGEQIALITGPNMGGKSTYLRQTALIVILAQTGSFVPASSASIGVVDRIFSRVGASDNLAGGQSTFLVEMTETANILHSATPRSLVLLDEVGRGTSTFDGLSLAWAIVEHLHDTPAVAARTMFATHYHELTELALTRQRVFNLHIAAREFRGEVVFLRTIARGAADQSYGIQVARLAGIPRPVIERAREVLGVLEQGEIGPNGTPRLARAGEGIRQLRLFGGAEGDTVPGSAGRPAPPPAPHPALLALEEADPDRMTPIEAMNTLAALRSLLREGPGSG